MKRRNKVSISAQILIPLFLFFPGLLFSSFAQDGAVIKHSFHDIGLSAIASDTLVTLDSTLAVKVIAVNKGRYVEEATVSLVDSASGDTIENWYPLFPPESADSTVMFWNTKGYKTGNHTLKAVLSIPLDSNPADNEQKRTVKVIP